MTDDELADELERRAKVLFSDGDRHCEDARRARDPDERQALLTEVRRCDHLADIFAAAVRGLRPIEKRGEE
jgi:hypothetical protein